MNLDHTQALALSDGTPVDFVKITSKDNIQVRVPSDHAELGSDPLRIFRRDGTHYKDATDLRLVTAAVPTAAPAPAAAQISANDDTTYEVDGATFSSLAEAKQEAIDLFDGTYNIDIIATTRKVVGTVGFSLAA